MRAQGQSQSQPRRRRHETVLLASTLAVLGAVGCCSRPAAAFVPPSPPSLPLAGRSAGSAGAAAAAPCNIIQGRAGGGFMGATSRRRRGAELLRVRSALIDRTTAESERVGSGGAEDPLDMLASQFEAIYNRALSGKPAQLKGLFAPQGKWVGLPMADGAGGVQEALDQLDQARSFFLDPRATVTGAAIDRAANTVTLDWQLSGTWPFPYRPRVRAAGQWRITLDPAAASREARIASLEETWDKPWWKYALEQAAPRGWDLWHLYLTPPSEKPLYRVVKRFPALEIREYYPRAVVELEAHDVRPDVKYTEYAWVLPDFGFTDELKLQGRAQYRETYVTTSPIETCVESVAFNAAPAKRITWHVPLPSHLGHDVGALPAQPPAKGANATAGEAARYLVQPRRLLAVQRFKGQTQTDNYGTARRWLLSWCQQEGLRTVKNPQTGKSRVWVQQHNMKAGFNMAGSFCLGIYEQPSYSDWGEIAVEIEGDAAMFALSQGE